jgi:hypothetical protein
MDDSANKSFPRVLVDKAFTQAVRRAGGVPVTDLRPDDGHSEQNADFVFLRHNVVAELKRLVKDHTEDHAMLAKLQRLYEEWVAEGKMPPASGRIKLNPANLPADCSKEMISLFREPFASRIRKANRQIKATKKALNIENAVGILIIAQDGDYSMAPKDVLSLVARCMNSEIFSNINSVIYINANAPLTRPDDTTDNLIWAEVFRDKIRTAPDTLLRSLSDAWWNQLATAAGGPISARKETSDFLDNLKFPVRKSYSQPRR